MEYFAASTLPVVGEGGAFLLYDLIASDIREKGFSVQPAALPVGLARALAAQVQNMEDAKFKEAGIGRADSHTLNEKVRSDEICWITGESEAGANWLAWADALKDYLNRSLFLGLFSFESHFAHYAAGAFYGKHLDAFKGQANRVLSLVVYLNEDWQAGDGGELVMYDATDKNMVLVSVAPTFGTIVAFLSEDFPHEVLPAHRDRYSIAGWFRLNSFDVL